MDLMLLNSEIRGKENRAEAIEKRLNNLGFGFVWINGAEQWRMKKRFW